jgi:hypothetical protein
MERSEGTYADRPTLLVWASTNNRDTSERGDGRAAVHGDRGGGLGWIALVARITGRPAGLPW